MILLMLLSAIGGGILVYAGFKNNILKIKPKTLLDGSK